MTAILGAQINHATPALKVTAAPTDASGYGNTGAAANITTGLVVAASTGGTGAVTFAWTQVGTTPYTWTINSPAAASTSFTAGAVGAGVSTEATFKVTATDAAGAKATATVTAFANNGQPYDPRVGREIRNNL